MPVISSKRRAQLRAAQKRWRERHHDQYTRDRQQYFKEKYEGDTQRQAYMREQRAGRATFRSELLTYLKEGGVPDALIERLKNAFEPQ